MAAAARPYYLSCMDWMGSGKSTLAARACRPIRPATFFRPDTIRRQTVRPPAARRPANNAGPYRPKNRLAVYWQMFEPGRRIAEAADTGRARWHFISRASPRAGGRIGPAAQCAGRHLFTVAARQRSPKAADRRAGRSRNRNLSEARRNLYDDNGPTRNRIRPNWRRSTSTPPPPLPLNWRLSWTAANIGDNGLTLAD